MKSYAFCLIVKNYAFCLIVKSYAFSFSLCDETWSDQYFEQWKIFYYLLYKPASSYMSVEFGTSLHLIQEPCSHAKILLKKKYWIGNYVYLYFS